MFLVRRRRPLAALSAALAVAAALLVLRPPTPPTVPILVAARDLDPGAVPGSRDVRTVRFVPATVPDHALRRLSDAQGRPLAAAVRRGEPITDVRLVGPQLRGSPGDVALPVRFADADAARLLRPGDRVDVLAGPAPDPALTLGLGPGSPGPPGPPGPPESPIAPGFPGSAGPPEPPKPAIPHARVVAPDTAVLARPEGTPDKPGGLLILSVTPEAAAAIAGAAAAAPLTFAIRGVPRDSFATGSQ
ncbi:SAF domain-containing protein [Yinghuangia soli]|uniref:SAF domain-containing protein n=1 Tax=Yinghuangia soli TaxID=2908204 RepID=A0AA41PZ00_9ACTN|nr:SAF domain-containing protein [Yinghuangia soli]MCF2528266.1 hypothetical protein [Yinghuangia soli]